MYHSFGKIKKEKYLKIRQSINLEKILTANISKRFLDSSALDQLKIKLKWVTILPQYHTEQIKNYIAQYIRQIEWV